MTIIPLRKRTGECALAMRGVCWMLSLLASAWSSSAGQAQEPPKVVRILITGNRYITEEAIRAAIDTRVGEALSRARLRVDREAIQQLGYFRAVAQPAVQIANQEASVTFAVTELPLVLHIRILDNSLVDQRAIRDVLKTKVGDVLCLPRLVEDVAAIQRLYHDRGYAVLVPEEVLDDAADSGIVRFHLRELFIDEVRFVGAKDRLERRLRNAIQELPGRPYQPAAVAEDAERLRRVAGVRVALPRAELSQPNTGKVRVVWHINPAQPPPPGPVQPGAPPAPEENPAPPPGQKPDQRPSR